MRTNVTDEAEARLPDIPASFFVPQRLWTLAEGLRIEEYRPAENDALPSHDHPMLVINVMLTGVLHETVGGHTHTLKAGMLSVLPPDCAHQVRAGVAGTRVLHLEIEPIWLRRTPALSQRAFAYRTEQGPLVVRLTTRLVDEIQRQDEFAPTVIEAMVVDALCQLCRSEQHPSTSPVWLKALVQDVSSAPESAPSLDQVARRQGIHLQTASRLFKRHVGQGYKAFLLAQRVLRACTWLTEHPEWDLAYLANRLGFADQSHFTRVFRAHRGQTPAQFRSQARQV